METIVMFSLKVLTHSGLSHITKVSKSVLIRLPFLRFALQQKDEYKDRRRAHVT